MICPQWQSAPGTSARTWPQINWAKCKRTVESLQARIVKARKDVSKPRLSQETLEELEPYALKGARTVLRGQAAATPSCYPTKHWIGALRAYAHME